MIHTVKGFSVVNEAEADVYYKDVIYVNIVNTVVMFLKLIYLFHFETNYFTIL